MIQRGIEAAGIPTTAVGNLRERMERVGYPRAGVVRFPRGASVGPPGAAALQRAVLDDTLQLLHTTREPGALVDLPYRWKPAEGA